MKFKWTDLALADLDHIETYITADNSPLVAIDVVLRIIDTVDIVLPEHPEAGRIGRAENTRELVIDCTPFLVIYRTTRLWNSCGYCMVRNNGRLPTGNIELNTIQMAIRSYQPDRLSPVNPC